MPVLGHHAIVLGASMGGLLSASVLADHFKTVTVVDRDDLPDQPVNRRGVPQGRHVHALLGGGAQALNTFFPGILQELRAGGAVVLDDGDLSRSYASFGGYVMPRVGRGKNFDPHATALTRPVARCWNFMSDAAWPCCRTSPLKAAWT
jgi:hypothetical protein